MKREEAVSVILNYGKDEVKNCPCVECQAIRNTWPELLGGASVLQSKPNHFATVLTQMTELHNTRQLGYGTDEDPYANVRASEEWNINGEQVPAWVGAMMRACDKIKRLKSFAAKGKIDDEKVEDCFLDCANYVAIGLVLYREQVAGEKAI